MDIEEGEEVQVIGTERIFNKIERVFNKTTAKNFPNIEEEMVV
jgi:hypothetical protein